MTPASEPRQLAHLPAWLLRRLAAQPAEPPPRRWTEPGALLFVDLVQFTALTEAYSNAGPDGAERLRRRLDGHFAALAEVIGDAGGEIAAFVGDALIAVFLAGHHRSLRDAVAAALAVGGAVRVGVGDPGLPQRLVVTAGELAFWALEAHPRRIGVVGGEPVQQLAAAHALAQPGEVLLSAEAEALAPLPGVPRAGGRAFRHDRFPEAPARPVAPPPRPEDIDAWLPRIVAERGTRGGWNDEFRTLTVLVLGLPMAACQADDPHVLQEEVSLRVAEVHRAGGDVLGVHIDEKGPSMLAAFGLPGRGYADATLRAVRCARRLVAGGAGGIGVATGRLYLGRLGHEGRADYGVLGSAMNLAARLAQGAGAGVLLDEATASISASEAPRAAGERHLKGWAGPVVCYTLDGHAPDAPPPVRLCREGLLEQLTQALLAGPAHTLLVGESGVGKSLLAEAVARAARERGLEVVQAACGAVEVGTPWHLWRGVLRALLADMDLAAALADLRQPERAALLNGIWPYRAPETELTRQAEALGRANVVRQLILELVAAAAARRRLLLVVEDLHWADSASAELLGELRQRLPEVCLLGCTRPGFATAQPALAARVRAGELGVVSLGPLQPDELARLLGGALGAPPSAPLVAYVTEAAGGHAYHSEQLALALADAGAVTVAAGRAHLDEVAARAVPTRVAAVVAARLDALPVGAQMAARVASVIGPEFLERAVRAAYPVAEDAPRLAAWLALLGEHGLIDPLPPWPEPRWAFRNAVTRDLIYEALLFAQRRELHRRVAAWLSERSDAAVSWPVLAWHWERAGEPEHATRCLGQAAAEALRLGALREADGFAQRALDLIPRARSERRARACAIQAQVALRLADHSRARERFHAALLALGQPAPGSTPARVLDLVRSAVVQAWHLGWGPPRRTPTQRRRDQAVAEAYQGLSEAAFFSLDLFELVQSALRAVNHAERSADARSLALAYGGGCIGAGLGGLPRLGWRWHQRALEAAEACGHLPTLAYVSLVCGVYANGAGAWELGAAHCARAALVFAGLGDHVRAATSRAAGAVNSFARGQLEEAEAGSLAARALLPAEGGLQVRVWCAALDVWLALARGRLAPAHAQALQALLAEVTQPGERSFALGALAMALAALGETDQAVEVAREHTRAARQAPPTIWSQAWGVAGVADVLLDAAAAGRVPRAEADQAVAVVQGFARRVPSAAALAQLVLAHQARVRGRDPARFLAAAREAASRLGMPGELRRAG